MNKGFVYTLLIAVSAIASLCSCQNELELDNNTNIDIPIPSEGYIFFSSGISDTRGAATPTGPLKGDFNVLGYRYPSTWVAINPQARQSLRITYTNNDNILVDAAETNMDNHVGVFGINHASTTPNYSTATPGVQTIIYDNTSGSCSYIPLQSWQKNLKYAFFAWYPTTLVANGGNNAYEGSPYITYTLPVGEDRAARESMADVLTGCRIDYTKRDGLIVPLKMKHRLAALDIKAKSLITGRALSDTYKEFDSVADDAEVVVDVTSLSLKLKGIHTSVKIPLDDTDDSQQMEATGSDEKTYTGFDATNDVTAGDPVSLVGNDELLMLIPQDDDIEVTVNVSYTVKCSGTTLGFTYETSATINGLEGGVYHYLLLTFTKSGLFVQANKAVTWKDKTDVEHTFE